MWTSKQELANVTTVTTVLSVTAAGTDTLELGRSVKVGDRSSTKTGKTERDWELIIQWGKRV